MVRFAFLSTLLFVAGCGGKSELKTYPVSGRVTIGDRPVAAALIVLHPIEATSDAPRPRATTGPDGTFTVTTGEGRHGAPVGTYRVTIEQWLASTRSDEGPSNRLPAKYAKAETSGLTVNVTEGSNQLPPFKLNK